MDNQMKVNPDKFQANDITKFWKFKELSIMNLLSLKLKVQKLKKKKKKQLNCQE